jgi:uncharacterized membrane protein YeiH
VPTVLESSVSSEPNLLLVLDLGGTFAFALNGALTAVRVVRLDIVGVLTLGVITAIGGGIIRDVIIDYLPPATFSDWRYLAVAAAGSLIAFALGARLDRWTGAIKSLDLGLGPVQAVILGAITAVGGGTVRDVLIQRVPTVLRSELYAIPALVAATITVIASRTGAYGVPAAVVAALVCFAIRMLGVRFGLNAPRPPGQADL